MTAEEKNEIAELICTKYCHYPYVWDEDKEGIQLCDSDICKNCPLDKLIEG